MPADIGFAITILVVSMAVSIDVIGLTLSKSAKFAQRGGVYIFWWSLCNALWHAGLLAIYIFTIEITIEFLINWFVIDIFDQFIRFIMSMISFDSPFVVSQIALLFNIMETHLIVIFGVLALVVVWSIYSEKISDEPASADGSEKLPALASILYSILEVLIVSFEIAARLLRIPFDRARVVSFLHFNFQAALVAVDMLALAFILKWLGVVDGTFDNGVVICLSVALGVGALAALAARFGAAKVVAVSAKANARISDMLARDLAARRGSGSDNIFKSLIADGHIGAEISIKVILRLAEPFVIFFFVMQMLVLMIHGQESFSAALFIGSSVFVVSLVAVHGYTNIVSSALSSEVDVHEAPGEQFDPALPSAARRFVGAMLSLMMNVLVGLVGIVFCFLTLVFCNGLLAGEVLFRGQVDSLDSIVLALVWLAPIFMVPIFVGSLLILSILNYLAENSRFGRYLHVFGFAGRDRDSPDLGRRRFAEWPSAIGDSIYRYFETNHWPILCIGSAIMVAVCIPLSDNLNPTHASIDRVLADGQFHALQFAMIIVIVAVGCGCFRKIARFVQEYVGDRVVGGQLGRGHVTLFFLFVEAMMVTLSVLSQNYFDDFKGAVGSMLV
jgi:hypothetical protein